MNVLGIDAAQGSFSAAIVRSGLPPVALEVGGAVALEQGLGTVAAALEEAHIRPHEIDRIAVGIGPGSFTGVRIAISYAKSLAQAWRLPLVGVSTFDGLEAGADLEPAEARLTVVRGRAGVVSLRLRAGGREHRASGCTQQAVEQIRAEFGPGILHVLGNAQDVLAALGERAKHVQIHSRASEPAALAVATVAIDRDPARSLHEVRADYGELPAAKVPTVRTRSGTRHET